MRFFTKYLFAIYLTLICNFCFSKEQSIIESLKQQLVVSKIDTSKVNLLNLIGSNLIKTGKTKEALQYFVDAELLANKLNYNHGLIIAINCEGLAHMYLNENKFAEDYFFKALVLSKKINDKKSEADIYTNLGILNVNLTKYSKALEYYLHSLTIREYTKDSVGIINSKHNIANIYIYQKKYHEALNVYLQLLKVKDIEENRFNYAQLNYNIGLIYSELKQYDKSLFYNKIALKIEESIHDVQGIALSYNVISSIYTAKKNYNEALFYAKKSISILNKLKDIKGLSEVYGNIGITYDSLKNYIQAETFFDLQLQLSKQISYPINQTNAYLNLSNHYTLTNEYDKALYNYKLYITKQDSITVISNAKLLLELETKFKTKSKETEIELLKAKQQLDYNTNSKQKQLVLSSTIVVALILLIVFLFYNRRQLKKRNYLQKKNSELERDALLAQMNPHFIFNSLGTISGFIAENNQNKAIEYIGVFSKLIRYNLEQSRTQLVTVFNEAEMLKSYLILEQVRYNNKFGFEIHIEKSLEDDVALPPMFVQPFIENAILHGVIPNNIKGQITVSFYCLNNKSLICEIKDNGIGKTESLKRKTKFKVNHDSFAIKIAQERVNVLNTMGNEQIEISSIEVKNESDFVIGTLVKLIFPLTYI